MNAALNKTKLRSRSPRCDFGNGLSEGDPREAVRNVFRASTAKERARMGLGIAAKKAIRREQGGGIRTVRPGGGSDFWFKLPLGDERSCLIRVLPVNLALAARHPVVTV